MLSYFSIKFVILTICMIENYYNVQEEIEDVCMNILLELIFDMCAEPLFSDNVLANYFNSITGL